MNPVSPHSYTADEMATWCDVAAENLPELGIGDIAMLSIIAAKLRKCGPKHPLEQFLVCIERLHSGGVFDLTDSPNSYMSNVKRLCEETRRTYATGERST